MDKKVIEITGLSKKYNNNILFENMGFTMNQGEVVGVIGENGAGKSVFLKMICGLITPNKGTVNVLGEELASGDFPKDIGVILDCAGFLPGETGFKNLMILANIRKKINREGVKKVMRRVGLDPESRVKFGKYSLGMKQRLAIAQAIMENPKLLILDEPFNAIDTETLSDFTEMFKDLNEKEDVSIIMTSHHAEEIERLCTKVYRVENRGLVVYR